ncbi:MAG: molybdate ABC transporter substrate-binding protein [Pseudomonadales bacterium]|nr:molybdate ABC transporter substrate-binding protein [Pseudomonadales bacterium]MBO6597715.1 molybdate ABC transporter substrate-binding protein [Pseudomonadales bacterium]MBO6823953.1 molybdate ABC transporter substrate-binding protein [Pseudomonadales bacterium]
MFRDGRLIVFLFTLILAQNTHAESLRLAVAANFKSTLTSLVDAYQTSRPSDIEIIPGSTGALTAQIIQGAPFHILFAADHLRPEELERRSLSRTRDTYAMGQLVFWTPGAVPKLDTFASPIAVANPRHAPFGLAAQQVLAKLKPTARLVYGNNVAQAFTFVQTGNVAGGFVSLAQVRDQNIPTEHYWLVPKRYHAPVTQQFVVMKNAPESADLFADWLMSPEAERLISDAGYLINTMGEHD